MTTTTTTMMTEPLATVWGVPLALVNADALALIIGVGLIVVLVVVRQRTGVSQRFTGALKRAAGGEQDAALLQIGGDSGEATMWNAVIDELTELRDRGLAADAAAQWGAGGGASDELTGACDSLADGLAVLDGELNVRYVNHAAARHLGVSAEALRGGSAGDALRALGLDEAVRAACESRRGVTRHELRSDEQDPRAGVVRVTVRPIDAGQPLVVLVLEDVTQQRVAEESRHTFIAQATHELRMPLTNVRLYVERLQELEEDEAEERASCINVINTEVLRLDRMIEEVLSVSEVESGSMTVQRDDVRVDELVASICEDYRKQAGEKRIEFRVELPPKLPVILADREKIALAVHNVLGNAIKYTPEGGTVKVEALVDGSDAMVIQVTDTGLGIADGERERVFDQFFRASDSRVRAITGTGLGLSISRDVIRLHGGDITVDSRLDEGSTFTITLPGAVAAERSRAA